MLRSSPRHYALRVIRGVGIGAVAMLACRPTPPALPHSAMGAVRAPEYRLGTIVDEARAALGVGAVRVCLDDRLINGVDTVLTPSRRRYPAAVVARLAKPGQRRMLFGTEGDNRAHQCAMLEAVAGAYDIWVQDDVGPFAVTLRKGHIDTLIVAVALALRVGANGVK